LALIGIPTNGLLKEKILESIKFMKTLEGPDFSISFSIDGPPAIHDKIRGIKGAYRTTWDTYLEARKLVRGDKRFHLHIETTVSSFNIQHLKAFFQKLLEDGHSLIVTVAHDAYLYKNEGNEGLTPDPEDRYTKELFSFLLKKYSWFSPAQILQKAFVRKLPHFLENGSKQVSPCAALKCSFAINPYGDVLPCLMWGKAIGNVKDRNMKVIEILDSLDAGETRKQIRKSLCPNCWTPCEAIQSIIDKAPLSLIV
jgi:sulfatase maturation enzyme AslB (radical SAM superfamily)